MYETCNAVQNLPLFANWQNVKTALNIGPGWASANGDGVLFYYMVENDITGPYYSYAIVEADRDGMGIFQPKAGATWISLLPGGGIKTYTTPAEIAAMNACIAAYTTLQTRNIPDLIAGLSIPISTLPNHPLKCFASAEAIWKFFDDNNAQINAATEIMIYNVASYTDVTSTPLPQEMKAQSVSLVYRNGASELLTEGNADVNKLFMDKALEHGCRCPPLC